MANQTRLVRWYKGTAILLLNTLVLFVLVNLVLWGVLIIYRWRFSPDRSVVSKYGPEPLRKVYAPMTDPEWQQLLQETWERPMAFEEFLQAKEAPFKGKYVNVSEAGYRITPPQGPWPIDPQNLNVFVFGGSTTFGYGVADDQTIPAHLQALLNKSSSSGRPTCVYNFGRCYYYSTPERMLFEQLLLAGVKPDVAVFIDGLNDFADNVSPWLHSPELKKATESYTGFPRFRHGVTDVLGSLPIGRLATFMARKITPTVKTNLSDPALFNEVIRRYLWNKIAIELLAREYGVSPAFVFQPAPRYHYDLSYHLFKGADGEGHSREAMGYPLVAAHIKVHSMGDDFLWLADMQKDLHKPLYCDALHYTSEFCGEIAVEIDRFILAKGYDRARKQ